MKLSYLWKLQCFDIFRYTVLKHFAQLRPCRGTTFCLDKGAKIVGPGKWNINSNQKKTNGAITVIKMAENATVSVNGVIHQNYGADITLEKGAHLILGDCFINSGCEIYCANQISIGNGTLIGQHVTIRDDDGHKLIHGDGSTNLPLSNPVEIGDHVWIAINSTVLKGVKIGTGAVVAAGSLVTRDVPAHCMVAGVPARVVEENIDWEQ